MNFSEAPKILFGGDPIGWLVGLAALVATVAITYAGWKRDRSHRDDSFRGDLLRSLNELFYARMSPAFDDQWNQKDALKANVHHIAAIAAMQSMSTSARDVGFVQFLVVQANLIQKESLNYSYSRERQVDMERNQTGYRRASIARAVALLQDELLSWQAAEISSDDVHSFAWHYYDALNGKQLDETPTPHLGAL